MGRHPPLLKGERPPKAFEGAPEPWLANAKLKLHPNSIAMEGPRSRMLDAGERAEASFQTHCDLAVVTTMARNAPSAAVSRYFLSEREPQRQPLVDCTTDYAD